MIRKSVILRNFRFCLLFCLCAGAGASGQAQEIESFGRGSSEFEGFRGGGEYRRGFDRESRGTPGFGQGEEFPGSQDEGRRGFRSRGGFGSSGGDGDWGGRGSSDGGFGRGEFRGRSEFSPDMNSSSDRNFSSSSSSSQNRAALKPKTRVTQALPASYLPGDLDGDGQIAFYEWKQWKRGDINGFLALDHNQDGFLTPSELLKGSVGTAVASSAPASRTSSSVSSSSPVTTNTQTVAATSAAPDPAALRNQAESMFRLMDRDRDGAISPEEWARSTRLKPRFEAAGVDLSSPTTKETFIEKFVALPPAP